jgi:hypothetical protein
MPLLSAHMTHVFLSRKRTSLLIAIALLAMSGESTQARKGFLATLFEHAAIETGKKGIEYALKHGSKGTVGPTKVYGPDVLSLQQLENCVVDATKLDQESQRLEIEAAELDKLGASATMLKTKIDAERPVLLRTDRAAVERFNAQIGIFNNLSDKYHAEFQAYKTKEIAFNSSVTSYNQSCAKKYYAEDMQLVKSKLGLN